MPVRGLDRSVGVSMLLNDSELGVHHVRGYCQVDLRAADMEVCGNGVEGWVVDVGGKRGEA